MYQACLQVYKYVQYMYEYVEEQPTVRTCLSFYVNGLAPMKA